MSIQTINQVLMRQMYIFFCHYFFKTQIFHSTVFGAYVFNKLKLVQEMVYGISSVIYDSGFSVPENVYFPREKEKWLLNASFGCRGILPRTGGMTA